MGIKITVVEVETGKQTVYNNVRNSIKYQVQRDSRTEKLPKLRLITTLDGSTNHCRCVAVSDYNFEECELSVHEIDLNERVMDDVKEVSIEVKFIRDVRE